MIRPRINRVRLLDLYTHTYIQYASAYITLTRVRRIFIAMLSYVLSTNS